MAGKRIKTPAMIDNPGGRPSEFERAAPLIIKFIRAGNTYTCASGCARINYHTFNAWMKTGGKDIDDGVESKFSKFYKDVIQAEKDCEQEILGHWLRAIPTDWKAGKEYLSRRNHAEWGAKDRLDVTSNNQTIATPLFLPDKKDDE